MEDFKIISGDQALRTAAEFPCPNDRGTHFQEVIKTFSKMSRLSDQDFAIEQESCKCKLKEGKAIELYFEMRNPESREGAPAIAVFYSYERPTVIRLYVGVCKGMKTLFFAEEDLRLTKNATVRSHASDFFIGELDEAFEEWGDILSLMENTRVELFSIIGEAVLEGELSNYQIIAIRERWKSLKRPNQLVATSAAMLLQQAFAVSTASLDPKEAVSMFQAVWNTIDEPDDATEAISELFPGEPEPTRNFDQKSKPAPPSEFTEQPEPAPASEDEAGDEIGDTEEPEQEDEPAAEPKPKPAFDVGGDAEDEDPFAAWDE